MDLSDGIVSAPPGAEPIGDRLKVGLENRLHHQFQSGLDNPVSDSGNSQASELSRPAGLGNPTFPYRLGTELFGLQLPPQFIQEYRNANLRLDPDDRQAIGSGGARPGIARNP